jgi:Fe2+ or Zn2+ uptake regulation protein/acyl-CoA thioesterase FadM
VLELLITQHAPAKAYDLLPLLDGDKTAKPPTIYRALDFLVRMGLAHRIESLNAFVACEVGAASARPSSSSAKSAAPLKNSTQATRWSISAKPQRRDGFAIRRTMIEASGLCCDVPASRMSTHPAPLPAPLYQGSVNTWECDDGGHLNVRFHLERAYIGLAHMAHALAIPRAFTSAAASTLTPLELHVRFNKEALPGAPLVMHGGVVEMGENDATLCLDMRHADGAPSSSFTIKVAHTSTRAISAPSLVAPHTCGCEASERRIARARQAALGRRHEIAERRQPRSRARMRRKAHRRRDGARPIIATRSAACASITDRAACRIPSRTCSRNGARTPPPKRGRSARRRRSGSALHLSPLPAPRRSDRGLFRHHRGRRKDATPRALALRSGQRQAAG